MAAPAGQGAAAGPASRSTLNVQQWGTAGWDVYPHAPRVAAPPAGTHDAAQTHATMRTGLAGGTYHGFSSEPFLCAFLEASRLTGVDQHTNEPGVLGIMLVEPTHQGDDTVWRLLIARSGGDASRAWMLEQRNHNFRTILRGGGGTPEVLELVPQSDAEWNNDAMLAQVANQLYEHSLAGRLPRLVPRISRDQWLHRIQHLRAIDPLESRLKHVLHTNVANNPAQRALFIHHFGMPTNLERYPHLRIVRVQRNNGLRDQLIAQIAFADGCWRQRAYCFPYDSGKLAPYGIYFDAESGRFWHKVTPRHPAGVKHLASPIGQCAGIKLAMQLYLWRRNQRAACPARPLSQVVVFGEAVYPRGGQPFTVFHEDPPYTIGRYEANNAGQHALIPSCITCNQQIVGILDFNYPPDQALWMGNPPVAIARAP